MTQHVRRSKLTIFPDSSFKTAWDCMGFIFIVYQSIMIPYNLCFGVHPEGGMIVFDTIIDCFFIIDICNITLNLANIVITFNTGFYQKGIVVMIRREIVANYLKTWFLLDLIASFPYNWVFDFEQIVSLSNTHFLPLGRDLSGWWINLPHSIASPFSENHEVHQDPATFEGLKTASHYYPA